jgi:hypothetical protein
VNNKKNKDEMMERAFEDAEAKTSGGGGRGIHTTNSDEPDEELTVDELDNQPRQNFVTGVPADEFDDEERPSKEKKSKMILIASTAFAVIVVFLIALFFILRGKSTTDTALVKDNSLKFGVNSNVSATDSPDYQDDYKNRYGDNSGNSPLGNVNTTISPGAGDFGAVGNNITAPPSPLNNNGGIYQPGQIQTVSPPPLPPPTSNAGVPESGNASTKSKNRFTPDKNTEIVALADNQNRDQSTGTGGGSGGRNDQVSLYFYDRPDLAAGDTGRLTKIDVADSQAETSSSPTARPGFGTVLPVKVLGRLHTLGSNGLARMELTRTIEGAWGTIPRGTMFVGRVSGGQGNRLFVSLLGYIDSRLNRLVMLGGDLQGKDGALGIQGDVKRVGSRWNKVFGELFSTAKSIGSAYLLGRGGGTTVNTGQLSQLPNALENKDATSFVLVPAASEGYIVINDLPPAIESDERLAGTKQQLSDEEILRMLQTNSPQDIERIIPSLSPRGQQIARRAFENKQR